MQYRGINKYECIWTVSASKKASYFMIIYLDLYSDSSALCPLVCRLGDIIRIINDDKYFNFFFLRLK